MKSLRFFYYLTILSVIGAVPVTVFAQQAVASTKIAVRPHDCSRVRENMLEQIQAAPEQLNEILGRSILNSKHCTCELLTAAIQVGDGSEASVKAIVKTALKNAGEMSSAIAECAVIAAPTQLAAIREAFSEVKEAKTEKVAVLAPSKGYQTSAGKAKFGTRVKTWMPSWKVKEKGENKRESAKFQPSDSDSEAKNESEESLQPDSGLDKALRAGTRVPVNTSAKLARTEKGELTAIEDASAALATRAISENGSFKFDFLWPKLSQEEANQRVAPEAVQWFAYVDNGFDSNVNTGVSNSAVAAYFAGGGIGTYYTRSTQDTRIELRGRFGIRYDADSPVHLENLVYRGQIFTKLEHQLTDKLTVSDQSGISYDVEPDFLSGETTGFRTDQYVFAYNRLAFGYRWAKHFETRTYYAVSTIQFEEDDLKMQEDRWRHLLGQQFRFLLNEKQAMVLEYRYGQTNFQNVGNDSQSHYFLGGVDFKVSSAVKAVLLGGAERRSFENFSDQWRPYADLSFQAGDSEGTRLRWGARLAYEDAELGEFRDRYSFRTGLSIDQKINDRLRASLGFFYLHSEFDPGEQDIESYTDDAVMLQLGLTYSLSESLDFYLAYHFTNYDSGNPLRNYDRHRVKIGLNSQF